jgi:hypothetical protein
MIGTDHSHMHRLCLALLIAVRCQNQQAVSQLLRRLYHDFEEHSLKPVLNRTLYLMTPRERDWMKALY